MGLFDFLKKKKNDETVKQSSKIEKTAKQTMQFDEKKDSKRDLSCPVCGITNTGFDRHYEAQAKKGVVIISRDKLVKCNLCEYVICTVCLNKAGGSGYGYPKCPSCGDGPSFRSA